jgi:hypothetical protein
MRAMSGGHDPRPDPASRPRRLLGDFLVAEGLVTPAQLEAALVFQRTEAPQLLLGQILVAQGVVDREALQAAVARVLAAGATPRQRLGALLLEAGLLSPEQLDSALRHQRRTGLRLGEVLLQLDLLPEVRIREALARQLGIAFVDPARLTLDPGAVALVTRRYARHHRVVPLGRTAGYLTLLVADPGNGDVPREVEASVGCPVRVVTTTQAGFQRAFHQAYGASV